MSLRTLKTSGPVTALTGIVTSILDSKSDGERHSAIFRIKVGNHSYRVVCHFGVIPDQPSVHDIWHITGQHKYDSKYGPQFVATTGERLPIEACTDQALVCEYIIKNPAFSGIGCGWVDKLNDAFPKTLVQTLESVDAMTLMEHPKLKMPEVLAESLLLGWRHCS
ncbi:exonuclease V subunit alpha, partial [Vibrio breoganii]